MKKIIKKTYQLFPFKLEIFSIIKALWKPKESIFKHLHFKGIFKVKTDKNQYFKIKHYGYQLENEIFWAGLINGWEKVSINLWKKLCEESEIIIDIGANTGIYSLLAKTINPKAKIFAFEPVDRVFDKLKKNIQLNNFDIVAIKKAISNKNGSAVIYDIPADHVYSVTVNKNLYSPTTKVIETTIETITLDSFINENSLNRIDLIKIDVETHEPEVMEGFYEYLSKFKPTILIEILNDDVGVKVYDIVKDLGYLYFNIDERGSVRRVDKIEKSDYYNYLLCNSNIAKKLGLTISH